MHVGFYAFPGLWTSSGKMWKDTTLPLQAILDDLHKQEVQAKAEF